MMPAMEVRKSVYGSLVLHAVLCVQFLARPLFVESLSCVHLLQVTKQTRERDLLLASLLASVAYYFAVAIIRISYTLSPQF